MPNKKRVYELRARTKVPWKNKKSKAQLKKKWGVNNPCRRLEIEGLYVYQSTAFFTSEGGDYCSDIKGKTNPFY